MNKKYCLLPLLIFPLLVGCESEPEKVNFVLGSQENEIIDLDTANLSGKMNVSFDSFILVTHQGLACTCWTKFQYVAQQYNISRKDNGKEFIPFFGYDTEQLTDADVASLEGIDKVSSGYVDLYLIINGKVAKKYSKSAQINFEMFESTDKFAEVMDKHIGTEPIKNYSYISYEKVKNSYINKDNSEFVLFTVRSGCGDCHYCMPNVVDPWIKENGSKIPVLVCDIDSYRADKTKYAEVKESLLLTVSETNPLGYTTGVVPTYQYWKNGKLEDAGVYANDSFYMNQETKKVNVKETYFDGTRSLKYTNANLVETMNNAETLETESYNDMYYMKTEKAAAFHDPLLKSFLSYYCK